MKDSSPRTCGGNKGKARLEIPWGTPSFLTRLSALTRRMKLPMPPWSLCTEGALPIAPGSRTRKSRRGNQAVQHLVYLRRLESLDRFSPKTPWGTPSLSTTRTEPSRWSFPNSATDSLRHIQTGVNAKFNLAWRSRLNDQLRIGPACLPTKSPGGRRLTSTARADSCE